MSLFKEVNESDTLVIAATGYAGKLNLPVARFFKDSGLDGASKIIITDRSMLKTLAGLPPDFKTFEHLIGYLENCISNIQHTNLIITGTSGGGHTALLLGHILNANKVVAFSPYPYLSIGEFKRMKDPALHSMSRIINGFDKLPVEVKKYLDLKNVLSRWNNKTEYFVHVSRYNKWDYKRANYLKGLPGVNVISHPYMEHATASMLSKESKLKDCFSFPYRSPSRIKEIVPHLAIPFRIYKRIVLKLTIEFRRRIKGVRG